MKEKNLNMKESSYMNFFQNPILDKGNEF